MQFLNLIKDSVMDGMYTSQSWQTPRHNRSQFATAVLLTLTWLAVAGCSSRATSETAQVVVPATAQTTAIANLPTSPNQTAIVYVKGTVGAPVPLLEGTVYPLQDTTGKVWVLTRQTAPKTGEEVVVKGTIRYKPISINGQEQGSIYIEQE
jgi:hypothetical protein